MPCNSDYLNPTGKELSISQVACLIDEINGEPINPEHWKGYHPRVYRRTYNADELVAELCGSLKNLDVSKYSLEMQIWWRDHYQADQERLARERKERIERARLK